MPALWGVRFSRFRRKLPQERSAMHRKSNRLSAKRRDRQELPVPICDRDDPRQRLRKTGENS